MLLFFSVLLNVIVKERKEKKTHSRPEGLRVPFATAQTHQLRASRSIPIGSALFQYSSGYLLAPLVNGVLSGPLGLLCKYVDTPAENPEQ